MNYWQNLWAAVTGGSRRDAGVQNPSPSGYGAASAVPVSEETALQVSAVWASVKLLSETVASLPIHVYQKTDNGDKLTSDHWLLGLLRKPNQYQTRLEFFETLVANLVLHGNAYAQKTIIAGRVRALLPLMSAQVETELMRDGSVIHKYSNEGGVHVFAAPSVWHLKLAGNCVVGKSPLGFGRNMIGIAQASEQTMSDIYRNGGKRSGVLSMDKLLTPEQRKQLRENFASLTTGDDSRLLVLEMGMKFDPISMSPQDIELLASRRFQIEEIARWFGVPSVLINDTSGSTTWGSGIAQILDGFYKLNLRPILERIEASIEAHLFTDEDREQGFRVEFDFEGLLRSDLKARMEGYQKAIQGSILTPNEARVIEGWPRVQGGDALLAQVNMVPIDKLGQVNKPEMPSDAPA